MPLSEQKIIDLLKRRLASIRRLPPSTRLQLGIGDDCALVKVGREDLILTTDTLVEGTHFTSQCTSPEDLSYKSISVNVSDIASMGGKPLYALISLVLPKRFAGTEFVTGLLRGLNQASKEYSLQIVGGDTVRGKLITISVAVLGILLGKKPITRAGSRPGDLLCLTGDTGLSNIGLDVLKRLRKAGSDKIRFLRRSYRDSIRKHLRPKAQLAAGLFLSERGIPTAMIDTSDSLGESIQHLSTASGIGFKVDLSSFKVHYEVERFLRGKEKGKAEQDSVRKHLFLLESSEDFELLFTCTPEGMKRLRNAPFLWQVIGKAVRGSSLQSRIGDRWTRLEVGGYRHFG